VGHPDGPAKATKEGTHRVGDRAWKDPNSVMILPQVHLRNAIVHLFPDGAGHILTHQRATSV